MITPDQICERETIAAYIDGELELSARAALEEHIQRCERCNSELRAQRQFMCELDAVLAQASELGVPRNFARVIAVHAESDMRGVRERAEHRRALRFCVVLGLVAFSLLSIASSKAAIFTARSIVAKAVDIFGLIGRALYDAAAGIAVVLRVLSHALIADFRFASLGALLLLAVAIGLLSLLLTRYHRTRLIE